MVYDWFKDAVFYEAYVRAFADSNGDGIGDIPGLTSRLDYLQALGINALWLLPIYPSPMRDDGYDVSDYLTIHPDYGTLEDFRALLVAAHERGIKVVVDLVLNHTSDQHLWFQASRDPNHPQHALYRDWYVWSPTDDKYRDTRIIFLDTEPSNWTFDPVRGEYFWHRFFSHQPDLNYDNPEVQQAILDIVRFWMDLGVDGFRADATPYLFEREGTSCENLPETHAYLKRLRAFIDSYAPGTLLLSEANQWPEAVRPYFGDGDEFHMNFHFPLMPRIYMALATGERNPIVKILSQTPKLPECCQWATFLRCHDELTLEMVSPVERAFMWDYYAPEPRMRLNMGIRRRLAPLLNNDRRRIEVAHSILFTLIGSPVLYYGDELGMGDDIWLEDRDGVRTPMQWNAGPNAGFSTAPAARLYSPVIADSGYGYPQVNVETQRANPTSFWHWVRKAIQLWKEQPAFHRGELELLAPDNPAILVYLRHTPEETILVLNNLIDQPRMVSLDLSAWGGRRPVDLFSARVLPEITAEPYSLVLEGYGYQWLALRSPDA